MNILLLLVMNWIILDMKLSTYYKNTKGGPHDLQGFCSRSPYV